MVLAALAGGGFLLVHFQEKSLKQAIFDGLNGDATIAARGISSFVEEAIRESSFIATTLPRDALANGRADAVEFHLKQMLEVFPRFQNGITVLDREGKLVLDYPSHPRLRGQSFASREYFQCTVQERRGCVSKPFKSVRTGLPVLTFTAPIQDANGQIVGVLASSVNLLSQEALGGYRHQKFGATGYLYVFDRSRLLVVHPEDERVMTYVEAGRNRVLEAATRGFEGAGETVNSQGVPMLLAVRQIPHTDWIVGVQVPQKEAYAPVRRARVLVLYISLIAILMAIALAAVAICKITRPLQQLENVASQIGMELEQPEAAEALQPADSALDSLRNIRSHDEIGRLASSFLRLGTKLHLAIHSLQCSAEDWHRTFNSINDAVVTLDLDSRIQRMNQIAEEWFRCSSAQVHGQFAYYVMFGTARPPEWPEMAPLKPHQRIRWSQRLEKPRGIFEFALSPVSSFGQTTGAVLVISDVTQRVESEEYIREIAKAFHIAERTLNILVKGFTEESPLQVASIIHEETGVGAVAITDTEKVLAFVGAGSDHHVPGSAIASAVTRRAIREKQVIFVDGIHEYYKCPRLASCSLGSVLAVPLEVDHDIVGTIELYEPRNKSFLNINKSLGEGITRLLSNQLLGARYQQQKTLLMKSELQLIHAQINPHFLFNALNTIVAILRTDGARARELLSDVSDFVRKNLKRTGDLTTLEEELDHANAYLQIEKARFGDRFRVETDIDPALLHTRIPTFTLQPLLENAIKHGISRMSSGGLIRIHAYHDNGVAVVNIEDNAGAFHEKKPPENGLGLKIVDTRLRNLLGADSATVVSCVPDKMTRISIRMPGRKATDDTRTDRG